ncbi:uncharacterized protein CYBJADRAFT_34845, partial [Cyberlindnera jadinii NRRL Y-1542]
MIYLTRQLVVLLSCVASGTLSETTTVVVPGESTPRALIGNGYSDSLSPISTSPYAPGGATLAGHLSYDDHAPDSPQVLKGKTNTQGADSQSQRGPSIQGDIFNAVNYNSKLSTRDNEDGEAGTKKGGESNSGGGDITSEDKTSDTDTTASNHNSQGDSKQNGDTNKGVSIEQVNQNKVIGYAKLSDLDQANVAVSTGGSASSKDGTGDGDQSKDKANSKD